MRVDWPTPRIIIDTAVLLALSALGLLGLATAFTDLWFLVAGIGGLFVGALAALVAAALRLGILLSALAALIAYFLFGSALSMPSIAVLGAVPTTETIAGLAVGAVFGWADLLTLVTPVDAPDYIGVVPYLAGVLAGLATTTIAARWFPKRGRSAMGSLVAILPPLALYIAGLLLGTEVAVLSAARGIAFALICLLWIGLRPSRSSRAASGASAMRRRRLVGVAVVAAVALTVGGGVAFLAAPAQADRFVLREEVQPPFDPLAYPSPLSGFRKYTKDLTDTTLFTVSGLEPGDRIRIATMDSYDGTVWNVTDAAAVADGSGAFRLVGRRMMPPEFVTSAGERDIEVSVADYHDVWLPTVGLPTRVEFSGETTPESTALRQNPSTGVVAVTSGVRGGISYTSESVVQEQPSDADLVAVGVANLPLPPVSNVPDIVSSKAIELAGDAATPIERLRAIEAALHSLGYLSHGSASDQVPSSAGHGADRLKALFERSQWIGDDEQFASAFALMARSLDYPARVVMGFAPEVVSADEPVDVTGDDVTAWVEVAFDDVGWIVFDPTPEQTDIPQDQTPKPKTDPQPQVRQPPSNDAKQEDLVSAVEVDDGDDEAPPFQIPGWVWSVAASVLIPLAIVFVPLLLVAAYKARRRARRQQAAESDLRAAGAWDEAVDVFAELGYHVPRRLTRTQLADRLADGIREEAALHDEESRARAGALTDEFRALARDADEVVFSGGAVDDERIAELWSRADAVAVEGRRSVSGVRRVLSRYRVRTKHDVVGAIGERVAAVTPLRGRAVGS